jgi:hypothetical protein
MDRFSARVRRSLSLEWQGQSAQFDFVEKISEGIDEKLASNDNNFAASSKWSFECPSLKLLSPGRVNSSGIRVAPFFPPAALSERKHEPFDFCGSLNGGERRSRKLRHDSAPEIHLLLYKLESLSCVDPGQQLFSRFGQRQGKQRKKTGRNIRDADTHKASACLPAPSAAGLWSCTTETISNKRITCGIAPDDQVAGGDDDEDGD